MTDNGHEVSFQGDKNIRKLEIVIVTQPCEYTKKN